MFFILTASHVHRHDQTTCHLNLREILFPTIYKLLIWIRYLSNTSTKKFFLNSGDAAFMATTLVWIFGKIKFLENEILADKECSNAQIRKNETFSFYITSEHNTASQDFVDFSRTTSVYCLEKFDFNTKTSVSFRKIPKSGLIHAFCRLQL